MRIYVYMYISNIYWGPCPRLPLRSPPPPHKPHPKLLMCAFACMCMRAGVHVPQKGEVLQRDVLEPQFCLAGATVLLCWGH